MTGHAFLAFAKRIAASSSDEAELRSATSRAYYGALHVAEQFLQDLGCLKPSGANHHSFIKKHLSRCGHTEIDEAATLLGDLSIERTAADYRLKQANAGTKNFAKSNVEMADKIVSVLGKSFTATDKSKMSDTVKAYMKANPT